MTAPQHIPKPNATEAEAYIALLVHLTALLMTEQMPGVQVKVQKLREPDTSLVTIHAWVPTSEIR